jgi:hypothetical protein
MRFLLDHLVCTTRAGVAYGAAALVGVAWAADQGATAPAGLPDISGVSMPIALVLATWLLRSGGPVLTIRLEQLDGDPPAGRRRPPPKGE